jgi:hypothetical protein
VGQLRRKRPQCASLAISPAVFDRHIPALDIAGIGEALTERDYVIGVRSGEIKGKKSDHRDRWLLRARHDGLRHSASKPRDKFPPSHARSPYGRIDSLSRSGSHVWP